MKNAKGWIEDWCKRHGHPQDPDEAFVRAVQVDALRSAAEKAGRDPTFANYEGIPLARPVWKLKTAGDVARYQRQINKTLITKEADKLEGVFINKEDLATMNKSISDYMEGEQPQKKGDYMQTFRKKPVEIQAVQWTGKNLPEVISFTGLHESATKWTWEQYEQVVEDEGLKIFTLEGPLNASIGDWIIKGIKGEFYPCKPDIFEATYDTVT